MTFDPELADLAERIAARLLDRGETVGVAEGSCGGLVSAALLSVPGASRYYAGGAVIYTRAALEGFIGDTIPRPEKLRGASEQFAAWLADAAVTKLGATWGIGEGGAAGPTGNVYGDPPGHAWVAVAGPVASTRHVLTGQDDRPANMVAFTKAALGLLLDTLGSAPPAS